MNEEVPQTVPETPEAHRKAEIITAVCVKLTDGKSLDAAAILRDKYPFVPITNVGRSYSKIEALRVFYRDGFVDRYSGLRLVFPGTLRILSVRMPEAFPYHKNGKTDECHFAFWELFPTIDHVVPVSRGGKDDETNWVTTSMAKNAAKANFTMEEIGWKLLPQGDVKVWDGQMDWFLSEIEQDPTLLGLPYIKDWKWAVDSMQRSAN
jgi:HNH endonuclease